MDGSESRDARSGRLRMRWRFPIAVQAVRVSVVQAELGPRALDVAALQATESPTLATPVPVRLQREKKTTYRCRCVVECTRSFDVSGCGGRER